MIETRSSFCYEFRRFYISWLENTGIVPQCVLVRLSKDPHISTKVQKTDANTITTSEEDRNELLLNRCEPGGTRDSQADVAKRRPHRRREKMPQSHETTG